MTVLDIVLLSAALAVAGRWAQGKNVDAPAVMAFLFLAVMLALISNVNEKVGKAFAWTVLVGTALLTFPEVSSKFVKSVEQRSAPKGGTP